MPWGNENFLGRYQQGQEVPLWVQVLSNAGVPVLPEEAPRADFYSETGLPISGKSIPILEPAATIGLFQGFQYLDDGWALGRYTVIFRWTANGGELGEERAVFEILPGGDGSGQVLALSYYHRPQADFWVQQRTSGRVFKGKNPRI